MASDLEQRAQQAAKIISSPKEYKVCEGCESIVAKKAVTCPNCHGYRFDDAPQRVIEQARILGARAATTVSPRDLLE